MDAKLANAVLEGDLKKVKRYLRKDADVHYSEDFAIRKASSLGFAKIARVLLDAGADPLAGDFNALLLASAGGKVRVLRVLIDRQVNIHHNEDEALRYASINGKTGAVQLLLAAGANVHAKDDWALLEASSKNWGDIVGLLLAAGANVDKLHPSFLSSPGHILLAQQYKSPAITPAMLARVRQYTVLLQDYYPKELALMILRYT